MPNFTPFKWFECDIASITKAGYLVEHEIKLSRSDLKADGKKSRTRWIYDQDELGRKRYAGTVEEKKHDLLSSGCTDGPRSYWLVTPFEMIDAKEVPDYAGWKAFKESSGRLFILKQAPVLHSVKSNPKIASTMLTNSYYRYWSVREDHRMACQSVQYLNKFIDENQIEQRTAV